MGLDNNKDTSTRAYKYTIQFTMISTNYLDLRIKGTKKKGYKLLQSETMKMMFEII